jgi:peptidylprolyl isomerase
MQRARFLKMMAITAAIAASGALLPSNSVLAQTQGSQMTTTSSGLQFEDTVVGTGAAPATGQTCVMHYTGWLYQDGKKGAKFDSSLDRGQPFEFPIGTGRVI